MVLVTGASGILGQALTRQLLLDGKNVRVLLRDLFSPGFEGLQVEKIHGNVTDLPSLLSAFAGVETVFHSASLPTNLPGLYKELYQVNVEGTKNVIEACRRTGVKRLVFIANYQALGLPRRGLILDESFGFNPDLAIGEYGKTMSLACQLVQEARDLSSVILLPSFPLGPFDYKLSLLGRFIWDFARGRVPLLVARGGFEIVDTRDVAICALRASQTPESGYTCIVSAGYLSVEDFMHWLEALSGRDRPRGQLPSWCLYPVGLIMELRYRLTGDIPILNRSSLKMLNVELRLGGTKAASLLNFKPRPLEQTMADAWNWLAEHYHLVLVRRPEEPLLTERAIK